MPAGTHEYKAALDGSWDENYGLNAQPNGANIPLTLAADTTVKFFYDDATHWVTDNRSSVIATARAASRASWAAPPTGTRRVSGAGCRTPTATASAARP